MEKQDLSDPQKESKFTLLTRSTCNPYWKLPALHPVRFASLCCLVVFFFSFCFFLLPILLAESGWQDCTRLSHPSPTSTEPKARGSSSCAAHVPGMCCIWGGGGVKTEGGNGVVNGSLQPGAQGWVQHLPTCVRLR